MSIIHVQSQYKVGTLDLLFWLVRTRTDDRTVEVWDGSKWVESPEGENIPASFTLPYTAAREFKSEVERVL